MTDLTGRVAIITGASRGIGRVISFELAKEGVSVVVAAREQHADAVASEIAKQGGTAESVTVDVTDKESVKGMVQAAVNKFGRIDILINNAGITKDGLLLRMNRSDWDDVLATNLTGTFMCSQAVLRQMLKQRFGRIISIGSVVGQMGNAGQANYAASKAGLVGFSKTLAREVAPRGITVNVIAPGFIDTEMTSSMIGTNLKQWTEKIPVGRLGTPEDVATVVNFLVSEKASYITGQVLAVNGGMYM